jgi:hypothetical protein
MIKVTIIGAGNLTFNRQLMIGEGLMCNDDEPAAA